MKVKSLLEETARDLNDFTENNPKKSFVRWTQTQLMFYWNEAINLIGLFNTESFTEEVVVKLKPGAEQDFSNVCDDVVSIIGESYSDGILKKELQPDTTNNTIRWIKKPCRTYDSSDKYSLNSYKVVRNGKKYIVSPPVPMGVDVYVKVLCRKKPSFKAEDLDRDIGKNITPDQIAIGMQWVLYRALNVDENSTTSQATAQFHYNTFKELLLSTMDQKALSKLNLDTLPIVMRNIVGQLMGREYASKQNITT